MANGISLQVGSGYERLKDSAGTEAHGRNWHAQLGYGTNNLASGNLFLREGVFLEHTKLDKGLFSNYSLHDLRDIYRIGIKGELGFPLSSQLAFQFRAGLHFTNLGKPGAYGAGGQIGVGLCLLATVLCTNFYLGFESLEYRFDPDKIKKASPDELKNFAYASPDKFGGTATSLGVMLSSDFGRLFW